jgi:hypothetical protein
MTDHRLWAPFDQEKLHLIREFLRREFRECHHRDFFTLDQTAHVFLIETGRGFKHTLIIPRATFQAADLPRLCNRQLTETLKLASQGRVLLMPDGPVACSP